MGILAFTFLLSPGFSFPSSARTIEEFISMTVLKMLLSDEDAADYALYSDTASPP